MQARQKLCEQDSVVGFIINSLQIRQVNPECSSSREFAMDVVALVRSMYDFVISPLLVAAGFPPFPDADIFVCFPFVVLDLKLCASFACLSVLTMLLSCY